MKIPFKKTNILFFCFFCSAILLHLSLLFEGNFRWFLHVIDWTGLDKSLPEKFVIAISYNSIININMHYLQLTKCKGTWNFMPYKIMKNYVNHYKKYLYTNTGYMALKYFKAFVGGRFEFCYFTISCIISLFMTL